MADFSRPIQLNYFCMSLSDPLEMLKNIKHLEQPNSAIDNYKREIFEAFTKKVIKPICLQVENEIRL